MQSLQGICDLPLRVGQVEPDEGSAIATGDSARVDD